MKTLGFFPRAEKPWALKWGSDLHDSLLKEPRALRWEAGGSGVTVPPGLHHASEPSQPGWPHGAEIMSRLHSKGSDLLWHPLCAFHLCIWRELQEPCRMPPNLDLSVVLLDGQGLGGFGGAHRAEESSHHIMPKVPAVHTMCP